MRVFPCLDSCLGVGACTFRFAVFHSFKSYPNYTIHNLRRLPPPRAPRRDASRFCLSLSITRFLALPPPFPFSPSLSLSFAPTRCVPLPRARFLSHSHSRAATHALPLERARERARAHAPTLLRKFRSSAGPTFSLSIFLPFVKPVLTSGRPRATRLVHAHAHARCGHTHRKYACMYMRYIP